MEDDVRSYVSPFNVIDLSPIPNFNRTEHKDLHIAQAGLSEEFEEVIWGLTNGYAK